MGIIVMRDVIKRPLIAPDRHGIHPGLNRAQEAWTTLTRFLPT